MVGAKVALSQATSKAETTFRQPPDLILIPTSTEEPYATFKEELDCKLGIASQFMLEACSTFTVPVSDTSVNANPIV